jgi:hypothetical protein
VTDTTLGECLDKPAHASIGQRAIGLRSAASTFFAALKT